MTATGSVRTHRNLPPSAAASTAAVARRILSGGGDAGDAIGSGAASDRAGTVHRPFFLAGAVVMLTAGAAWGVWLLWRIGAGGSFTGTSVLEVNAHGHAQIMGWIGLFVMGSAYRIFPRLWRVELPAPAAAIAVWLAMLGGITARSTAMMMADRSGAGGLHALGVGLELAAVAVFLVQLAVALGRSGERWQPYLGFVFAALACFLLQTAYSGWHMARLMQAPSRDAVLQQVATFQGPLRDLQIHGVAVLMIFGVAMRLFPATFSLAETPVRRGWTALGVLLAAIGLEMSLFLTYQLSDQRVFATGLLVPWLMLPIGAGMIVGPWRLWRPLPEPARGDRSGKFVRAAFAWLFLSLAMLVLLPGYQAISGIAFSHAYYGAIRHAITVGFISMMIVGMSSRLLAHFQPSRKTWHPNLLSGTTGQSLPGLWLPFMLINAGCLWRVVFQIGSDWHPFFFDFVGISGILEWTGFAVWAIHVTVLMFDGGSISSESHSELPPAGTLIAERPRLT